VALKKFITLMFMYIVNLCVCQYIVVCVSSRSTCVRRRVPSKGRGLSMHTRDCIHIQVYYYTDHKLVFEWPVTMLLIPVQLLVCILINMYARLAHLHKAYSS
jgi:hypothetical protein